MRRLDQKPRLWLTAESSEDILNRFSQNIQFDQPFDPFKKRDSDKLESILNSVKQTFGRQHLNPTVLDAAAAYFNQLVRGHAFENGNKRIAVLFTHVFLLLHGIEFTLDYMSIYKFALLLAIFSDRFNSNKTKEICRKIINDFTREIS